MVGLTEARFPYFSIDRISPISSSKVEALFSCKKRKLRGLSSLWLIIEILTQGKMPHSLIKDLPHILAFQGRRLLQNASNKLFLGGLSYDTNEPVLRDAFAKYGKIIEVKVICDRVTGKSKGFGFIQFSSAQEAGNALLETDGKLLEGRNIRVEYADKVKCL